MRTGKSSDRQLGPYKIIRSRATDEWCAEADASVPASPYAPHIGLPELKSTGGIDSETTSDAEIEQTHAEEEIPVSNFCHFHILVWLNDRFCVRHPNRPGGPTAQGSFGKAARRNRKML